MDFRSHEQLALALDADAALEAFSDFAFDTCGTAASCASLSDSDTNSLCSLFSNATDSDCASPASPLVSNELHRHHQEHVSNGESSQPAQQASKPPKTAAATAKPKPPRKHNRLEILKLRDEMEALLAQLETLKKTKDGRSSGGGSSQQQEPSGAARTPAVRAVSAAVASQFALRGAPKSRNATAMALVAPRSVWLDLAVEQYAHLQQSETLNRKLRAAVKKQMKLGDTVQLLLRKKSVKQELVTPPPNLASSHSQLPPAPMKIADLYENMQVLFARAPVVSRAIELSNDTSSAFNSARTKQDVVCGPSLEITTSTPIACDFRRLGEMVWKGMTVNCVTTKFAGHPSIVDAFERQLRATFTSAFGDILVNGKAVIRKFEDASRVVLAFSSKYNVSGSDLVLREHSWVIAADSFVDSSESEFGEWSAAPTSHFQTLYRLFSEQRDPSSASGSSPFTRAPDARTKHIQEVVTKGLGDRMREHALQLQNMLLAEMELVAARKGMQFRMPTLLCPCS